MKTKKITIEDLENLAIGAAILGSGGGGNPAYDVYITKYMIEQFGQVNLISLDDVKPDDLIVPVAYMGAPLVGIEKLPNTKAFDKIFELIEKDFGKKPTIVMPAEIGGSNAFTPLFVASKTKLPVLDADLLGRAFPQLQMSAPELKGLSATPAYLEDVFENAVKIVTQDSHQLESIARSITVAMGSSAALTAYVMTGEQVKNYIIPGTVSQAIKLGSIINYAQKNKKDPIKEFINQTNSIYIGSGIIVDIDQSIKDGFLEGTVKISDTKNTISMSYQNENLIVSINNKIVATTPDIIIPLDSQTGIPITTESLTYGVRASVVVIHSPAIWQTKEGLNLVGPRVFGYDVDYKPAKGII